jgi:topoisomerase-4 subunit A
MKALLVQTSLETRYAINLTWLGLDGLPETKGIVEVLREWTEFRVQPVRRRTAHRLEKCEERLHIVMGRLLALAKIDEIIKLIRACDDQAEAKDKLRAKWKFSERQAEDIVNLRLGQLTRLDGVKLNDERKSLEGERKGLKTLLGDDKELRKLVVKELEEDAKKYGDARRTLIEPAERAQIERSVLEEPLTVILSNKGWIRARSGHGIDLSTIGFKDGDALLQALECKTTSQVAFLSARGKTYTLEASALPGGRGDGQPMNALVNCNGDDIVWMACGYPAQALVMSSSAGRGFLCRLGDLFTKTRAGKEFMNVAEGARANAPTPYAGDAARLKVAALSSDARLLVFPMAELPLRPNGGVGVQLIALPDKVTLAAVAALDPKGTLTVSGFKRTRKTAALDAKALKDYEGKRAQRGRVCDVGFRPDRLE